MIESVTKIQVRYAETDMMGIVYHANYLPWLEIGRTELLRENGLPYKEIEARGLMLPVLAIDLKYKQPAKYDDSLTIVTRLLDKPLFKIVLHYEIKRQDTLLLTGSTTHAFVTAQGQPVKPPLFFTQVIEEKFVASASK